MSTTVLGHVIALFEIILSIQLIARREETPHKVRKLPVIFASRRKKEPTKFLVAWGLGFGDSWDLGSAGRCGVWVGTLYVGYTVDCIGSGV